MNEHQKLLSCWHKLEHFSPAELPKGKDVALLHKKTEPWKIPLKSTDPNRTIEYTVYLGVFNSGIADDFVADFFNDHSKDENDQNSKICFAALKLDNAGRYIKYSFGLSTLPWALSQLESRKINKDRWGETFDSIKNELEEYLELHFRETNINSENEIIKTSTIISYSHLLNLQDKIESVCGWSVKPDKEIYVKRNEKFKSENLNESQPTSDILNSFYIKDLEKIISIYGSKYTPEAFRQYLEGCLGKTSGRTDLIQNTEVLKANLEPRYYPDGCWPSDYTLSLMQQFAVNNIFNELSGNNKGGLFSVNGPPGTGKTTLLRDIIAPIIVKRAKELSKMDNPSDAFEKIGILEIDDRYAFPIYKPDTSLTGGGILIASSNNGAVENISRELPMKEEVAEQYRTEITYFKSVAEECIHEANWGIISAVLGKKENKDTLASHLWFNKDQNSLRNTLKETKYLDNQEWDSIRRLFNTKLNEVTAEKERLSNFKREYEDLLRIKSKDIQIKQDIEHITRTYRSTKEDYDHQKSELQKLEDRKRSRANELSLIRSSKPHFFSYWFNKTKRRLYGNTFKPALKKYDRVINKLKKAYAAYNDLADRLNKLETRKSQLEKEKELLSAKYKVLEAGILKARSELQEHYADSQFWDHIETQKSQEACPWYSERLKKLQSELFIIALKLNETFILTANSRSGKISTTLSGFFKHLSGGSIAAKEEIKAMWDTFFLVIPVVSSTFASIQTMFKDLEKEDIPWLFIDEAGQAVPQAAAGAIWRSKRVGVVGDPFQIEPVVTISRTITNNIRKYFNLSACQMNPELSVQSMADQINPLGAYLTFNNEKKWIGMPLRVHRRCIDPMFEISNHIAYDNMMFGATAYPKNVNLNFSTTFIHCKGIVEGKHFVREQTDKVQEILLQEIELAKDLPDVFVITPFNEISHKLKSSLFTPLLYEIKKHKRFSFKEMNRWLAGHIGTIHTFQGKQAEGVILCLGLDASCKGAAKWASRKPNLLNVAITRAKYRFLAIGDEEIWLKQPYFEKLKTLNKGLPI